MDDVNNNSDPLPVLTEIARPESLTLALQNPQVMDMRIAVTEADPGGYDPYNKAPPTPAEKTG